AQDQRQRVAQRWLVVGDQEDHAPTDETEPVWVLRRIGSAEPRATGKSMWNAAPPSRAFSTQIVPLKLSTMLATIASPRPVPFPGSLVVKNGSKIFSRSAGGMPGPQSATTTFTISAGGFTRSSHIRARGDDVRG